MSFLGGIVGALGDISSSLTGGLVNHYFGKKAAKQSYGYAMSMSNSAHQREVKDLEAAGLNPVLSAMGNGAATVAVPVSPGSMTSGNQISTALNSAQSRALQREQIALVDEQERTQKAVTDKTKADGRKAEADAALAQAEADFINGLNATGIRSPFRRKYYGEGTFLERLVRDASASIEDGATDFLNAVQKSREAGADGGRHSAKSIEHDRQREKERTIRAVDWIKNYRGSGGFF